MHRQIETIPEGDILIHAGDGLGVGTLSELKDLDDWLGSLPHPHKLLTAGNHDWIFQREPEVARLAVKNATYLEDSGVTIQGIRFWGSPWTPVFRNWAFNLQRGAPLAERWAMIPLETDILITHGPPWGILDNIGDEYLIQRVGCHALTEALKTLSVRGHIFGHIHEGYGLHHEAECVFVNASTCNERYQPVNPAVVIEV